MSNDADLPVTEFRFHPSNTAAWHSRISTKWLAVAAFALAGTSLVAVQFAMTRVTNIEQRLNDASLFSAPADLNSFIARVQQSVVIIECQESQGSGWVIDLGAPGPEADADAKLIDKTFPTEVITNHHVIEDCVKTPGKVRATARGETYDAWLYSWDTENDLALVAIRQKVPALEVARKPRPGQWVMAVGAPYGLEGSVSIGNVINTDAGEVVTTAPFNAGNSGSPLVNSVGRVVGTSTWSAFGDDYPQDWNVAEGIPLLCSKLVDCVSDRFWNWE